VEYGAKLPEVCTNIQDSVSKALETMTGLTVREVNISVEGLKFAEPEAAPVEE
ncbi:MAG: Asp23/Gls24 family envelope stress response protein, partial [Lachnospiraceae bacterium]